MSDEWVSTLLSMVYSRMVADFSQKIKDSYKMTTADNFAFGGVFDTPSRFPFANMEQLESPVAAEDLERTRINEVLFGFQVDVYDNQGQARARTVAYEILRIMRKMLFTPAVIPTLIRDDSGIYRMTARYQRAIDWNDIL